MKKVKKVSIKIVKKNNYFTRNNITYIDYKDTKLLSHFVNKQGQIIPKTFVRLPSKIQRMVAKNIKRARQMKLMPYIIVNQGEF
ncbi:30S ribosomal protein S18 [endosymbiont GvMRE of Glomus versiforme]|uniref:30S ribosomal protein S18 n=1 Tax=endosymbiont GvMRE of Glomus versiforme TaxID=2039283 RepID=UPI001FE2CA7B|nr:30S ribosomal protein S18 [endosymbiont GvMRE of Glomus versiforme]